MLGDSWLFSPHKSAQQEIACDIFGAGAGRRVWHYTACQNTVSNYLCVRRLGLYTCRRPEPLRTQIRIGFANSIRVIWLVGIPLVSGFKFCFPLGAMSFIWRFYPGKRAVGFAL